MMLVWMTGNRAPSLTGAPVRERVLGLNLQEKSGQCRDLTTI